MDLGLQGKVALVTGAHRGTGELIARCLAEEGATVWVHGLAETDAQGQVAEALRAAGGQAHSVWGDLRTDAGADRVQAELAAAGTAVEILVNNYGGPAAGGWHRAATDDWAAVYQQNVLSAVRMIDRFVPGMRAGGFGRVIQLATIGTLRPNRRMPHYYASKAAMANLTVSLAKELAGSGVTANTVSPGLIHTPEVEASFRALAAKRGWGDDWGEIETRAVEAFMPNPCGRMATRREVAELVTFLASARAGYINGSQLRIDGGATDLVC